jgi:hypothetical protein
VSSFTPPLKTFNGGLFLHLGMSHAIVFSKQIRTHRHMKFATTTTLSIFTLAHSLSAHAVGHTEDAASTAHHLLSSPDHLLMIGSGLVISIVAIVAYRRRHAR